MKGMGQFSLLGIEIGASVIVGFLGGYWLDEKLSLSPWLTMSGFALGLATGARAVYRAAKAAERMAEEEEAAARRLRSRYLNDRFR